MAETFETHLAAIANDTFESEDARDGTTKQEELALLNAYAQKQLGLGGGSVAQQAYLQPQTLTITSGTPDFATYAAADAPNAVLSATSDFRLDLTALAGQSGRLTVTNNGFQMSLPTPGANTYTDVNGTLAGMSAATTSEVYWYTPNGTDYSLYITNLPL